MIFVENSINNYICIILTSILWTLLRACIFVYEKICLVHVTNFRRMYWGTYSGSRISKKGTRLLFLGFFSGIGWDNNTNTFLILQEFI